MELNVPVNTKESVEPRCNHSTHLREGLAEQMLMNRVTWPGPLLSGKRQILPIPHTRAHGNPKAFHFPSSCLPPSSSTETPPDFSWSSIFSHPFSQCSGLNPLSAKNYFFEKENPPNKIQGAVEQGQRQAQTKQGPINVSMAEKEILWRPDNEGVGFWHPSCWDNLHLLWEPCKTERHQNHTRITNNKHFPYSLLSVIYTCSISQLLQRTAPSLYQSSALPIMQNKTTTNIFSLLVFIMVIMPERPVIGMQGACSGWQRCWEIALVCTRGSCW